MTFGASEVDFPTALRWLREKWNVSRLLCEGGGGLHGALVGAGLVDELHLTICPIIFGGQSAPAIAGGGGVPNLADAARFKIKSAKRIGQELFVVLERAKSAKF